MPFEEVVEAEGHLIDSHVMEQIFDKVVESSGRFEIIGFSFVRGMIPCDKRHTR